MLGKIQFSFLDIKYISINLGCLCVCVCIYIYIYIMYIKTLIFIISHSGMVLFLVLLQCQALRLGVMWQNCGC